MTESHSFESAKDAFPVKAQSSGGRHYRGASGLFACHMRALRNGVNILDPETLAGLTPSDLDAYYRDEVTGRTTLQHLEGRLAKYQELGTVLRKRYDGRGILPDGGRRGGGDLAHRTRARRVVGGYRIRRWRMSR